MIHNESTSLDAAMTLPEAQKELDLKQASIGTLEWSGRIISPDSPWVAVVVADEDPAVRKKLVGAAWEP